MFFFFSKSTCAFWYSNDTLSINAGTCNKILWKIDHQKIINCLYSLTLFSWTSDISLEVQTTVSWYEFQLKNVSNPCISWCFSWHIKTYYSPLYDYCYTELLFCLTNLLSTNKYSYSDPPSPRKKKISGSEHDDYPLVLKISPNYMYMYISKYQFTSAKEQYDSYQLQYIRYQLSCTAHYDNKKTLAS